MAVGSSPPWLDTTAATAPAGCAPVPARSTTKPSAGASDAIASAVGDAPTRWSTGDGSSGSR